MAAPSFSSRISSFLSRLAEVLEILCNTSAAVFTAVTASQFWIAIAASAEDVVASWVPQLIFAVLTTAVAALAICCMRRRGFTIVAWARLLVELVAWGWRDVVAACSQLDVVQTGGTTALVVLVLVVGSVGGAVVALADWAVRGATDHDDEDEDDVEFPKLIRACAVDAAALSLGWSASALAVEIATGQMPTLNEHDSAEASGDDEDASASGLLWFAVATLAISALLVAHLQRRCGVRGGSSEEDGLHGAAPTHHISSLRSSLLELFIATLGLTVAFAYLAWARVAFKEEQRIEDLGEILGEFVYCLLTSAVVLALATLAAAQLFVDPTSPSGVTRPPERTLGEVEGNAIQADLADPILPRRGRRRRASKKARAKRALLLIACCLMFAWSWEHFWDIIVEKAAVEAGGVGASAVALVVALAFYALYARFVPWASSPELSCIGFGAEPLIHTPHHHSESEVVRDMEGYGSALQAPPLGE